MWDLVGVRLLSFTMADQDEPEEVGDEVDPLVAMNVVSRVISLMKCASKFNERTVRAHLDAHLATDNSPFWAQTAQGMSKVLDIISDIVVPTAEKFTPGDLLRIKLDRAQYQLIQYHEGDGVHDASVVPNLLINQDAFNALTNDQLKRHFNEIERCEKTSMFMRKLAKFAEGDLYVKLSKKLDNDGEVWISRIAALFGVDRKRVRRALLFRSVIRLYPGLLVVDLSYTWILNNDKRIIRDIRKRPEERIFLWERMIRPTDLSCDGVVFPWEPLTIDERKAIIKGRISDKGKVTAPLDPIEETMPALFENDSHETPKYAMGRALAMLGGYFLAHPEIAEADFAAQQDLE